VSETPYRSFAELAVAEERGRDWWSRRRRRPSRVAVIAPHGGRLEQGTDAIAEAIAGRDFASYVFLAMRRGGGNPRLHVTSRLFDDPRCLDLLRGRDVVLAVHGCGAPGETVFLGGLDAELKGRLAAAFRAAGLDAREHGHPWPGRHPDNVCNRGRRGAGVQLELTWDLRHGPGAARLVAAARSVLPELDGGPRPRGWRRLAAALRGLFARGG